MPEVMGVSMKRYNVCWCIAYVSSLAGANIEYPVQVQGLLEIFDREWLNLYAHTPNASALYHIRRDRAYWKDLYSALSEFWWECIVPAKHCIDSGGLDYEKYR